jgi:hypothetical protein
LQAITVQDRAAGTAGLALSDIPRPHASENDVIVRVHAAGFTPGELDWPGTWTDRARTGANRAGFLCALKRSEPLGVQPFGMIRRNVVGSPEWYRFSWLSRSVIGPPWKPWE